MKPELMYFGKPLRKKKKKKKRHRIIKTKLYPGPCKGGASASTELEAAASLASQEVCPTCSPMYHRAFSF